MRKNNILSMVVTAIFTALICVFTLLVQIPIPATGGYANLGDGVILICAFLLTPVQAAAAAGLGSMLADVLTGYMVYAPGTFIIKALLALLSCIVFRRLAKGRKSLAAMLPAALIGEGWMVLGYFLYESLILHAGLGALGGVMGNVGQAVVGMIAGCAVAPVLHRSRLLREFIKH